MSAHVSFDLSPMATCIDDALTIIDALHGSALDEALRSVEHAARRMDALRSAVIARGVAVERHKADGHRRPRSWVAALTSSARADASVSTRVAEALSKMPRLRAAYESGAVPFAAVEIITRRIRDDRVVERLIADDELLTRLATSRAVDDVRKGMTGWDQLADPVGSAETAAAAHRDRRVRIERKDGGVRIHARLGALDGATFESILRRFGKREFERDAAASVDGELPRTADQRSADALMEAMLTADRSFTHDERPCDRCGAPAPVPTGSRDPLVNIVWDDESFRRWAEPAEPEGPIDWDRLRRYAARTSDGDPVPFDDIARSMLLGRVRIIVRNASGVIERVGVRQRLFRGRLRDAVILQHDTCTTEGCGVPASQCEADHLDPHAEGGPTVVTNGGPSCDHHNRWRAKHRYRMVRDTDGRWHTIRPDGTTITGAPPPPPPRAGPGAA